MQTTVRTFREKGKRKKRHWTQYNLAHTSEKIVAMRILNEAVNSLNIPYEYNGIGRPPMGIDDMIKCCVVKVYNSFSTRHIIPDLNYAHALGYIKQPPHFNIISKYMRNPEIEEYLHKLYNILAQPLVGIDEIFAPDATGFGTHKKDWMETRGWFRSKKVSLWKEFKKLHIVCGTLTTIITEARTSEGRCHDSPFFKDLIRETAKRFDVKYVCADSGYLSKDNCEYVKELEESLLSNQRRTCGKRLS